MAKKEPEWWAEARRLRKLKFYGPRGGRNRLEYADIARIVGKAPISVAYALNERFRAAQKVNHSRQHQRKRDERNYRRKLRWALGKT